MNIYELIKQRRSIRAYVPGKEVPEDVLSRIIEAGCWSASGKNLQNWRFFVLTGAKRTEYLKFSQKSWLSIKDSLEKRLKPSLYKFTERFFFTMGDAPVVIIAFAEINDQDHPQTQLGNVYLAVQNMVLAAQSEGLGTCIMGSPLEVEADIRAFLGATRADWKLVCGLTIGYPAHSPPAPPRQMEGRVVRMG
ncbi:MAG: nitroreductase family protein [Bdellovibrionota bacterium]